MSRNGILKIKISREFESNVVSACLFLYNFSLISIMQLLRLTGLVFPCTLNIFSLKSHGNVALYSYRHLIKIETKIELYLVQTL